MRPLVVFLLVLLLGACGHPATRQECEEIFVLSAQLELRQQKVTDPDAGAELAAVSRASMDKAFADKCVGRRISDDAMQCARSAKTAPDFDRCLSW